ncbi:MAG: hypothetical protein AAFR55_05420 [Pseudomonadota bacterium]
MTQHPTGPSEHDQALDRLLSQAGEDAVAPDDVTAAKRAIMSAVRQSAAEADSGVAGANGAGTVIAFERPAGSQARLSRRGETTPAAWIIGRAAWSRTGAAAAMAACMMLGIAIGLVNPPSSETVRSAAALARFDAGAFSDGHATQDYAVLDPLDISQGDIGLGLGADDEGLL